MLKDKTERRDLLAESGRVTPREVLEAYRKTGIEPGSGDWDRCALGAMAHAHGYFDMEHPDSPFALDVEEMLKERGSEWRGLRYVASDYEAGFSRGFDGQPMSEEPADNECPWEMGMWIWEGVGWRDGRRAARFVFGA